MRAQDGSTLARHKVKSFAPAMEKPYYPQRFTITAICGTKFLATEIEVDTTEGKYVCEKCYPFGKR